MFLGHRLDGVLQQCQGVVDLCLGKTFKTVVKVLLRVSFLRLSPCRVSGSSITIAVPKVFVLEVVGVAVMVLSE